MQMKPYVYPFVKYILPTIPFRRIALAVVMLFCCAQIASAQSSMTDQQVMQFIVKENSSGTSRADIVTKLMEKGVQIDQIRRVRNKYEKQKSGAVAGARDISGKSNDSESRLRTNNGDKRKTVKGENQRNSVKEKVDESSMSEAQLKRYRREQKEEYMDEMEDLLPDSLSEWELSADEMEMTKKKKKNEKEVFGRNIFNNSKLSFEPNMNIATPQDYRLGPGDAVYVDVWGASQERFEDTVSPDGTINIEKVGPINVDGLTVAQANQKLKSTLGKRYGGSKVQLTLGQTRTITVDVMGEVKTPGTFTLSAFSTVFNALYMAGGVNEIGTLRNIKIYRKGRLVSTCDIYDYILNGKMSGNVRLTSGDVIIVGPYECLVNITGKVKRPMYYEMKATESVGTLVKYAGGFAGDAYQGALRLVRKAGGTYSVYSIDDFEQNSFQLADGDSVSVDSTLERYSNMVEVKGAVMRPGMFQMDGSITSVRQLIEAAGGLSEDAFVNRGFIHRRKDDRTLEVIEVNIKGVMEHSVPDISLKNEDVFYVPSQKLMKEERVITIDGEVNYPGIYEYADNTSIETFILQAGGLKDAASLVKIDVARRNRDKTSTSFNSKQLNAVYTFSLKDGFVVDGTPGFILEPFDEVYVRKAPGYKVQQHVTVSGEIMFQGLYPISASATTNSSMRLSDLVKLAGGVTDKAYIEGAHLERQLTAAEKMKQRSLIKAASLDSVDMKRLELNEVQTIGIELKKALENPGSAQDIVLRDGDQLVIPEYDNTVSINGQVNYPNVVAFSPKSKLEYYIDMAGGYSLRARKNHVFAIHMNGTISRVRSAKDITPGCSIFVPQRSKRNRMTLAEMLSIGSMTATIGTIIATLIK